MNKVYTNIKWGIQISFFKIIVMWARSVQYAIGELWCWGDKHYKQLEEEAAQSFVKEVQKEEIDDFVKSMQRQAKITGARPKKDNEK
jgi:hypothetical protein